MTAMIGDSFTAHGKHKRPARSAAERTSGGIRDMYARRRPVQADELAAVVLRPLLDGARPDRVWVVAAFLLGMIARDTNSPQEAR
jgi:hypothetical protein